jgi:hypothetical protein
MQRRNVRSVFFAACVIGAIASGVKADLITNGSFENGTFVFDANGADSLPAGSTAITGWTTFGAELAVIQNANTFGVTTPFGTNFLDLTGYHDSAPYGGVMQTITTTPGLPYQLTQFLGVFNDSPQTNGPISVTVTAGGTTTTFTDNPVGPGAIWTPFSFNFLATGASTPISIQGLLGKKYIGLDNVSVNQVTPEPSSLALLGLGGLGMTGLVLRRGKMRFRSR